MLRRDTQIINDRSCSVLYGAGQGLCLALEDAVVMAWHLQQQGLTEEAFRR